MGGPAQKIHTDVLVRPSSVTVTDIAKSMCDGSSVTLKTVESKQKIIRFRCPLCKVINFTVNGYQYHVFSEHKKRNAKDMPPEIVEGHDVSLSSSQEKHDDSQNESLPNIIGPSEKKTDDERKFSCPMCPEKFFYENAVNTHLFHAHQISVNIDDMSNISDVHPKINEDRDDKEKTTTEVHKPRGRKTNKNALAYILKRSTRKKIRKF